MIVNFVYIYLYRAAVVWFKKLYRHSFGTTGGKSTKNLSQGSRHFFRNDFWTWHRFTKDRQSTHNQRFRSVRVTIAAMENNKYYICSVRVCSLSYSLWNARVPYCIVICGLSSSTIFSTLSKKDKIFRKNLLNVECVLLFSTVLSMTSRNSVQCKQSFSIRMYGWTDVGTERHDATDSRFRQICEGA
jgi:hypothetical protein